jgi:hypothetical protein
MVRVELCSVIGMLALLAITLSGCGSGGDKGKDLPPIGGFYASKSFDPSSGSFAGLAAVSDLGNGEIGALSFVGTDDGANFWNVYGKWTDKSNGKFIAYFSHRNPEGRFDDPQGFANTTGTLSETGIHWDAVANHTIIPDWTSMKKPSFNITQSTFTDANKVGGFYKDGKDYKEGTFKGTRMIASNYFPRLTFLGSDDGTSFWTILGRWDGPSGSFIVDFSPIGGRNVTGKINHNNIEWSDSTFWAKQDVQKSSPQLPHVMTV